MAVTRRGRSTRLLVVGLVAASLLTITADYRGGSAGPLEIAGRTTLTVVGSMQDAVTKVFHPFGDFFSGLVRIGSLEASNRRLVQELNDALSQNGRAAYLETEVTQLQGLLHMRQTLQLVGVGANVIGQSISNFEWTITIDQGQSGGIRVGMPVVAGAGLVGHVVETGLTTSVVQLLIDPNSAVAGRLLATGDTGLVVGDRNQDLQMNLVSPSARVTPNEQVVTAGFQGSLYPAGLLIGFVSREYTDPQSLSKIVSVRPAVDFSSLQFVLVLTKNTSNGGPGPTPRPSASGAPSTGPSPTPAPSPSG